MRARLIVVLAVVAVVHASLPALAARASGSQLHLAQDPNTEENTVGGEEEAEGQETSDRGGRGPGAEVGADEGETEGAATESGPPWTYQMAWLGLLLLVVLAGGVGLAYYRFVIRRQRGLI